MSGKLGYRKPITGYKKCEQCPTEFPFRESLRVRGKNGIAASSTRFCSHKCRNQWLVDKNKLWRPSEEQRKRSSEWARKFFKGRRKTEEQRKAASLRLRGPNSHFWAGGVTPENKLARETIEYALWREAVFTRDDYTCQECGQRGGILQADHVKPFSLFPELRLDISNGKTLCIPCHKKTPTYGWKLINEMKKKHNLQVEVDFIKRLTN